MMRTYLLVLVGLYSSLLRANELTPTAPFESCLLVIHQVGPTGRISEKRTPLKLVSDSERGRIYHAELGPFRVSIGYNGGKTVDLGEYTLNDVKSEPSVYVLDYRQDYPAGGGLSGTSGYTRSQLENFDFPVDADEKTFFEFLTRSNSIIRDDRKINISDDGFREVIETPGETNLIVTCGTGS